MSENPPKKNIMIVDDEIQMREMLKDFLEEQEFSCKSFSNGHQALAFLSDHPTDLVITDWKMKGMDGMELIEQVRHLTPLTPIIMITAFGSIESAVAAIKRGASQYMTKPFKLNDCLRLVQKTLKMGQMLKTGTDNSYPCDTEDLGVPIISKNEKMKALFNLIRKINNFESSVLITGETGTGKDLIARAIHFSSKRSHQKFVAINCSTLPEPLLESELFGHAKGSFTGATHDKKGLFMEANGGVIFLDEIGEMPISLQAKLLRVLQHKTIRPVGSTRDIPVDARVIAATNQNILQSIEKKEFREDLFFRLNVIPIEVPPLRERMEDIPDLVRFFLQKFNKITERNIQGIHEDALLFLQNYDWKGNIRELENFIERAVILCNGDTIQIEDFIIGGTASKIPKESLENELFTGNPTLEHIEKEYITRIYNQTHQDKDQCALTLGISKRTLYRKLERYGFS